MHRNDGKGTSKNQGNSFSVRLTARETAVLQWSAWGKSSWEISRIFGCTESAVNFHFGNIRRKYGVSSRYLAALHAIAEGAIVLH